MKYLSKTLNAESKESFKLSKEDGLDILYVIEVIIGENKLNNNKLYLDYSFEHDVKDQTYQNSTELTLNNYTDEYGKQTFIFNTTDKVNNIIMSFFISSKSEYSTNTESISYSIKYRTFKLLEDIKVYKPDNFTVTVSNSSMLVTFKELFNDKQLVERSKYEIKVYLKNDIKDISLINRVISLMNPIITFRNTFQTSTNLEKLEMIN